MQTFAFKTDPLTDEEYLEVYLRGRQVLTDPLLNKGTAFTSDERRTLGLDGLLRSCVSDIETQRARNYEMYSRKQDDLEKYIFLQSLLNRNEILFYDLLCNHLEEMLPIVYTPTVGQACTMFSHITREYRGVYISPDNIGDIDRIFQEVSLPEVRLIVVTDGERILGLGDLGSDGMGIPVGKINLYVAAGGLHPACCLPVCLDVGTNNERLLADPLYTGCRRKRMSGKAYDDFVERFVLGVKRSFPRALLQWEDFAKDKAFKLLERYADRILSFDDDIQGTGAVATAALMSAMRIRKERLRDQRFAIAGMGQAGAGIAASIRMMLLEEGLSDDEARTHIFACDLKGLVTDDQPDIPEYQKRFAQHSKPMTLREVVRDAKPSVLIGVTATKGLFDAELLAQMARNHERPVILALSNPTSKSECTAEEVIKATGGKALVATGSPFPGTSQCNNMFIFPGVGLGALVSNATKVTANMFLAASKALSAQVRRENMLLPDLDDIRAVSAAVAKAVACEARDSGIGLLLTDEEFERVIAKAQWQPHYYRFRPAR
ncbi:MAG TPA: NAD-dependent malic enzyme [Thermoanaerobaculia bacterium]|nr:NAD-dependent malic enzyme [Thermoanaerobaculia bacterium]